MAHYSYYALLEEIYRILRWQSEKLTELENELSSLKESMENGAAAKTNVEKIEYNFEQLKVENLNGTLHIGISPGDAAAIDDLFQKGTHTEDVSVGNQQTPPIEQRIQDDVYRYIRDIIPPALQEKASSMNADLTEEQIRTIVEDMIRQTGDRVSLYMQHFKGTDGTLEQEQIADRIKGEIFAAVEKYIDHFRKEREQ